MSLPPKEPLYPIKRREDKIGLNNETRFREEMIKLNKELFQFKGGVNQAYLSTKEIYNIHNMLSLKIKNN